MIFDECMLPRKQYISLVNKRIQLQSSDGFVFEVGRLPASAYQSDFVLISDTQTRSSLNSLDWSTTCYKIGGHTDILLC